MTRHTSGHKLAEYWGKTPIITEDSIATVVDDFIDRIMMDPRLNANPLVDEAHHRVPPSAEQKYNLMPISVGTDPDLALKTRPGTGYYKVPSLKGVWCRRMFGHRGWCATLEDRFDPRPLRDDYVPIGFKPFRRPVR